MTESVEAWANGLISSLEPAARKELAREMAKDLRAGQQKRIAAQQNPDGTAFEPRKQQLRSRKGKLRRTMFAKLRTARFLKAEATADAAIVSFTDDVQRIAQVHQSGLRDRVDRKKGTTAQYPARRLLGITDADESRLREIILAHLARK